jgi:hypothetical protein
MRGGVGRAPSHIGLRRPDLAVDGIDPVGTIGSSEPWTTAPTGLKEPGASERCRSREHLYLPGDSCRPRLDCPMRSVRTLVTDLVVERLRTMRVKGRSNCLQSPALDLDIERVEKGRLNAVAECSVEGT